MPLEFARDGERVLLWNPGYTLSESKVWRMLRQAGVPVREERGERGLGTVRYVMRNEIPLLEKGCRMLGIEIVPAAGEAPLSSEAPRKPYVDVRPFDVADVLAHASDVDDPIFFVRRHLWDMTAFLEAHPEYRKDATGDVASLEFFVLQRRQAGKSTPKPEGDSLAVETSLAIRGVPGDDAFRAHGLLLDLAKTVEGLIREIPAGKRIRAPERIPGFHGSLRPYQREGVDFLLSRDLSGILADEMGLGKTVMAIAAVLAAGKSALVVGPANVLYNWAAEVERFTGRSAAIYHERVFGGPAGARFLVTTYDALPGMPYDDARVRDREVLILDEAHYVRNPETQRAKQVHALPQATRLLLTGTPMVNGIEDYYELLRHVGVSRWASYEAFRETWVRDRALFDAHREVRRRTVELLHRVTRDVLLRRKKDEVLTDLPPRTLKVNRHEIPPRELALHKELALRAAQKIAASNSEVAVFAELHALRQHVARLRFPVVLERVREILSEERSLVVYSQYL
ncbi:MAG: DEAD/DEAH box helicase, partial [Methanobacteriota archaeon]